jgi:hypothetical protein
MLYFSAKPRKTDTIETAAIPFKEKLVDLVGVPGVLAIELTALITYCWRRTRL